MVGDQLGIGHDPGQHAAYTKSWVQVLKEDPTEILRAARDADKIYNYVLAVEKGRMMSDIEIHPNVLRAQLEPARVWRRRTSKRVNPAAAREH